MTTVNDITPNLGLALPHPANDADVDIIRLRNMIQTLDAAIPALLTNAMGNVLTSLHTELQTVISALNTVAPAGSALSTDQWTNARAALLDRLDAAITSRAPAATALSTAVWTNELAQLLSTGADKPISQYTESPLYRVSGLVPVPDGTRYIEALLCGGGGVYFGGVEIHRIPVIAPTMTLTVGAGTASSYGGVTSVEINGTLYASNSQGSTTGVSTGLLLRPFSPGGGGAVGWHGVNAFDQYYEQYDTGQPGASLTPYQIWGLSGFSGAVGITAFQSSNAQNAYGGGGGGLLGPGGAATAASPGQGGDGGGGRGFPMGVGSATGGNGFAKFRFFK